MVSSKFYKLIFLPPLVYFFIQCLAEMPTIERVSNAQRVAMGLLSYDDFFMSFPPYTQIRKFILNQRNNIKPKLICFVGFVHVFIENS